MNPKRRVVRYVVIDVFTDTPLEGNPLAVFPDGDVDEPLMQAVARELNLAETVFVQAPRRSGDLARLRIFTPRRELDFAGHPTIGTAAALQLEGRVAHDEFTFEEGVGSVPVRRDGGEAERMFWLTTPPVEFGETVDKAACAEALSISTDDLLDIEPQYASAGSPFLFVALRTAAAVDRAVFQAQALPAPRWSNAVGVFIFAPNDGPAGHAVYSRMFAPAAGIPEDPATGGATGPLAAYMLRTGLLRRDGGLRLVSEQGVKMRRRSVLHVAISGGPSPVIEVGGRAVKVADGKMMLPIPT